MSHAQGPVIDAVAATPQADSIGKMSSEITANFAQIRLESIGKLAGVLHLAEEGEVLGEQLSFPEHLNSELTPFLRGGLYATVQLILARKDFLTGFWEWILHLVQEGFLPG